MSDRLADVETRIETAQKLSAIIAAMRGIAAARVKEAAGHVESIRTFADTIGDAIGQALALLLAPSEVPHHHARERSAIVLIAAEQGFAGTYNDQIISAALPQLETPHVLFLVGERGHLALTEAGHDVAWSAAMVPHPTQVPALATRLTEAIYEKLAQGEVTRVFVIHAVPGAAEDTQIVAKQLVPFDFGRFPPPSHGVTPLLNLPPQDLLTRLAEEYVFAELSEAIMLAFAAENSARMRAMEAAHDNVTKTLDDLVRSSRRLRQEQITEEIVELSTDRLALR